MCRRTYNITFFSCNHKLETLGSLVPEAGCDCCGIEKGRNDNIASTTQHIPCEDCQVNGLWSQTADGKWYEVAEGGPKKFTPGYKFPCQFLRILKITSD